MHELTKPTGSLAVGAWLRIHAWRDPWTSVIGLSRTLLALGTAGTLLSTPADVLFGRLPSQPHGATCHGTLALTAFCVGGSTHRQALAWLWGAVLVLIATGWRPRLTGPIQWWISCSFFLTCTIPDGGDQVTSVLTLFLLPIVLTDSRRWHWSESGRASRPLGWPTLVADWGLVLLKAQVAVVYLDAAISKLGVPQWSNGTAMYYWLRNPVFGVPPSLLVFEQHLLGLSGVVAPFTFGVMLLEVAIGVAFVLPPRMRRPILVAAVAFHVGIAVVMGLVSFAVAMIAGLVVYLVPVGERLWSAPRPGARTRSRGSDPAPAQCVTADPVPV